MVFNCPGSQQFKQPKPENIKCPSCGRDVEIWSDEVRVVCPFCKAAVTRQTGAQSCLDWCEHARECVGEKRYANYMRNKKIGESMK